MKKDESQEINELYHTGFEAYGNPMKKYIHDKLLANKHYKKGYNDAKNEKGEIDRCWKEYKNSINN